MNKFVTQYNVSFEIGTSETLGTWSYADIAAGIDNVTESLNEVVQQYKFYDGAGFAENHVTGMAPSYTFTGRRVLGDTAQDYIFGKKWDLDGDRDSSFKMIITNNIASKTITLVCPCTICNVQELGGAATDDAAISFEIRLNGAPTVTEATIS